MPHTPLPIPVHDPGAERRLLTAAAGVALALHAGFFLLPLRLPTAEPPRVVAPQSPSIRRLPLPPPPLPEVHAVPSPVERPTPVPFSAPDVDPLLEPFRESDPAPVGDAEIEPLLGPGTAPPAPAVPVDEHTQGLTVPRAIAKPDPAYPAIAVRAGKSGRVVLRAVIGPDGSVDHLVVLAAPRPDLGFVAAAIEAVSRWRYEPGLLHGEPVAVSMTVVVEFTVR